MSSHWVNLPSLGCFAYLERDPAATPALCRALIESLLEVLALDPRDVKLVAYDHRRWRGFAWSAVDEAISDPAALYLSLMVGSPSEVHLGARLRLRGDRAVPPCVWFCAESQRWSANQLVAVGRRWLALTAEHAEPISGGVAAATSLLAAKNEVSLEYESMSFEPVSPADALFTARIHRDHDWLTWNRIRRIYPVTLLGPAFASAANAELLRAAGTRVEELRDALVAEGHAPMIPAWDPAYLAATIELRRVAWPVTIQNLADAEGLGHRDRFEIANTTAVPSWEPAIAEVRRELGRQRRAMQDVVKRTPERPRVSGELARRGPELQPPARGPTPEPPPDRKRKAQKLSDRF